MTWFDRFVERWDAWWAPIDAWEAAFIKKYLDINTYSGAFRNLILLSVVWYVMWHPAEIYSLVLKLGASGRPLTPGEIAWYRFWANIMCGGGVAATVLSIIMMTFRRFRARNEQPDAASEDKSADGDEA